MISEAGINSSLIANNNNRVDDICRITIFRQICGYWICNIKMLFKSWKRI